MDALELETAKQSPAIETAKDLFSGAVGGIAQVLIGMFNSSSTPIVEETRIAEETVSWTIGMR
jgi:hypothetical protein